MTLAALQRDFCGWLRNEQVDMDRWFSSTAEELAGLAVYHNAYRVQLVDCLREGFEKTLLWLGEDAFLAAAQAHIEIHSPHHWTLDVYGDTFDRTLRRLYPSDPEVAELAWLDRALSQAFQGADAEPLPAKAMTEVDWDTAHFRLLPTLRVSPAATNAGAIWSALAAQELPPAAAFLPEPAAILVWREGFTPCFRTIETAEQHALDLIICGATFGDLCTNLIDLFGEEGGVALAGKFLGQWIGDGLIVSIRYSERE